MTTLTIATVRASSGLLNLSTFHCQWIQTFRVTYNCNFDDGKCRRDAVIDRKAYSRNQGGGMEVWIKNIIWLASR